MIGLDYTYFLIVGPFFLLAMWASFRVKSAFAKMSQVPAYSGLTGAQVAEDILTRNDIRDVRVERSEGGQLSDHYDPQAKVVRLSPEVYEGTSLASLGVAAHEVGHAIQDAKHYGPLKLRNGIVPLAAIGGNLSWFVIVAGIVLGLATKLGLTVMLIGVGLFSLTVLFQIINLPVEFDASRRARVALVDGGLIAPNEDAGVAKVLNAAALTYVAATLAAIATLIYYLLPLLLGGHRSEE